MVWLCTSTLKHKRKKKKHEACQEFSCSSKLLLILLIYQTTGTIWSNVVAMYMVDGCMDGFMIGWMLYYCCN